MVWDVRFTSKAKKQAKNLPPKVRESLFALVLEMKQLGPARNTWHNYGTIKGKPTYVAIWKVTSKESKHVEVRYVGTHENADYERIC